MARSRGKSLFVLTTCSLTVILICISLIISDVPLIFSLAICRNAYSILWPFFNQLVSYRWILGALVIFCILISYWLHDLQIFFPFSKLPFYFAEIVFRYTNFKVSIGFNLSISPTPLFFFLLTMPLVPWCKKALLGRILFFPFSATLCFLVHNESSVNVWWIAKQMQLPLLITASPLRFSSGMEKCLQERT